MQSVYIYLHNTEHTNSIKNEWHTHEQSLNVTHCAECVTANTRSYQLCLGWLGDGSCTCIVVAATIQGWRLFKEIRYYIYFQDNRWTVGTTYSHVCMVEYSTHRTMYVTAWTISELTLWWKAGLSSNGALLWILGLSIICRIVILW